MKSFKIFKINNDLEYILLTSTTDLYFLYDEILKEYNIKNKYFSIIIDMLYINGFTFNRFVQVFYENGKYKSSNIINPRNISEDIKYNTRKFFKENKDVLNNSTLSKLTKDFE